MCSSINRVTLSIVDYKPLMHFLWRAKVPYFLVAQWNQDYGFIFEDYNKILFSRKAYQKACASFFVSRRGLQATQRQLAFRFENGHIIKNPVNLVQREYIPYPSLEPFQFASVARLDCNNKGQDVLIETLSSEKWRNRDWMLNLYGSGSHRQYLLDLIEGLGLQNKVILHGFTMVDKIWLQNHLLIMPSINEGTPLALVEAMIAGRPAVVTDVSGMTEWVSNGINGFVAEAPQQKYLDRALEAAWSRREEWPDIGKRARQIATSSYEPKPGKKLLSKCLEILERQA